MPEAAVASEVAAAAAAPLEALGVETRCWCSSVPRVVTAGEAEEAAPTLSAALGVGRSEANENSWTVPTRRHLLQNVVKVPVSLSFPQPCASQDRMKLSSLSSESRQQGQT